MGYKSNRQGDSRMNVQIFIKRNLARYPRNFDETYSLCDDEEMFLMSGESAEVAKDLDHEYRAEFGILKRNQLGSHTVKIEGFYLSPRFILVDLEAPEKRLKEYRRCGFSTKKYNHFIGGNKK